MVTRPSELKRDLEDVLVQHYIHNPYIINGGWLGAHSNIGIGCLFDFCVF